MAEETKLEDVVADLLCRAAPNTRLDAEGELVAPVLRAVALTSGGGAHEFTLAAKDEKRLELLGMLREGEVVELEIDVEGFSQVDGVQNSNFVRFKKSILGKLGKSFSGVPFLKDHAQGKLDSRAGTVIKSKAESIEGGKRFVMTLRVSADWAVRAVLEGNLDRFSIGWSHGGLSTIECSVCKGPFLDCWHFPGDVLEDEKTGEELVVEFVFTQATGIEISGVNVPAVAGTGIEEIRSALSLAANRNPRKPRSEDQNMNEIAKLLGLKADADEDTIAAALKAYIEKGTTLAQTVEQSADEKAKLSQEVVELKAKVAYLEGKLEAGKVEDIIAEHSSRFPVTRDESGELCQSELEKSIRELAGKDIEAAKKILHSLPEATKVATPIRELQSVAHDEAATPPAMAQNAFVEAQCQQLGITPEEYARFNPVNGTEVPN